MNRRRVLMAAQSGSGMTLQDVPVGALVKLGSGTTTQCINIGVVDGISLLLREKTLYTARQMGKSTAGFYDYDTSSIDKFLMGDNVYGALSEAVRNKMVDFSVTYSASDGTNIITKTIQRKVFVPTYDQTISSEGVPGVVLSALMAYKETDTVNTARKALRDSTTTAVGWWLMSVNTTPRYYTVSSSGSISTGTSDAGGYYPRPLFAFQKTIPTILDNGIYVCQF